MKYLVLLISLSSLLVACPDKDEEEESRFMLQLELRGLGALGQQADRELQESIYGYQPER